MRFREISLFLLFCTLMLFSHEQLRATLAHAAEVNLAHFPVSTGHSRWRYAEDAEFYGVVPERIREMRSERPGEVARAVCQSFGGQLDIIQRARDARDTVGFNCAFSEPDVSMTADFGDLRRIPERIE